MSLTVPVPGLLASLRRARTERLARRALERELAGYTTGADRDDLAALIAGRGAAADDALVILDRQVRRELFRVG